MFREDPDFVARDDLHVRCNAEHSGSANTAKTSGFKLKPKVAIAFQRRHVGSTEGLFKLLSDSYASLGAFAL